MVYVFYMYNQEKEERDPCDEGRDTCVSSLMHWRAILASAMPTEGYFIVIVTLTDPCSPIVHAFIGVGTIEWFSVDLFVPSDANVKTGTGMQRRCVRVKTKEETKANHFMSFLLRRFDSFLICFACVNCLS